MSSSLENLKKLIEDFGFVATNNPITDKIVIHGVAGCGKSTLTRELIKDSGFNVVNALSDEKIDLTGQYIKKDLITFENKINVLDEYLSVDHHEGFQVLLADPFQYSQKPYLANYTKKKSHRFKKELVPILLELGIEVQVEEEGLNITRGSAYDIEPKGKIICIEKEVAEYVSGHGLEICYPCCVQGQEFEVVTFYYKKELKELSRSDLYIALTRVRRELKLLQL
nr:triple gene block protein 2 [Banmivirus BanMMV]